MKTVRLMGLFLTVAMLSGPLQAAHYIVDIEGMHAAINFRIKHLGYSWLTGRFNNFNGHFNYDESNPKASSVSIEVDTASVDTNHAERDKHLRDEDFLEVKKYPKAKFVSNRVEPVSAEEALVHGELTLHGVTRPVTIEVHKVGGGPDPWGDYRQGFAGTTTLVLKDFGIDFDLGPASTEVQLDLHIEGIRQDD